MSIPKIVESIFADTAHFPKEGMTQKDVVCSVLEQQNNSVNPANIKRVQPNVSRALAKLISTNQVTRSAQHVYHPVTPETAQRVALMHFSENVYCLKPDIFAVVDTMYLIKVHSDHVFMASEYLKRYLGSDRYFDIFYSNSYLWVLWEEKNNNEEEFRTVYQEISDAVAVSYERYVDSQRKLVQLQKAHASQI